MTVPDLPLPGSPVLDSRARTTATPAAAPERPRITLNLKLFALMALLIFSVVALAVGVTVRRADAVARATAQSSILSAAQLFEEFQKQRLERLALAAQIVGTDPAFVSYIQHALSSDDTFTEDGTGAPGTDGVQTRSIDHASILDNLLQRREQIGSDLMMVLDDEGVLLARTDQPLIARAAGDDLYEATPLVRDLVDDASVSATTGILNLEGRLFHAAVSPVGGGARNIRIAYIVNAYALDERFANRIAESTQSGVFFTGAAGAPAARSSNAPAFSDVPATDAATGMTEIDRSRYILTTRPLLSGENVIGAAVFLRSLDRELAPFRQIERAMILAGAAALLLAFVFSWLIARRITRPIEELAGVAQGVTAGEFKAISVARRSDEIGILSRAFGRMVNALRDQAELEQLYSAMIERSGGRSESQAARLEDAALLVTDLRGLSSNATEPAEIVEHLTSLMQFQEREISRQEGEVVQIDGQRLVSIFRGDRGVMHAVRAARTIQEDLAASRPGVSLGAGLATGEFISGSVSLESSSAGAPALVGEAPLLALLLAWHAPPGQMYVAADAAGAAGDLFQSASADTVALRWLATPIPVVAMPLNAPTATVKTQGQDAATLRLSPTDHPERAAAELARGALFAGRYRIERLLGRGGMGVVYRAVDSQLGETVAIKTLSDVVTHRSPQELERFKREIRLARKITHRNVLRTYDYGEADGIHFISMEYVRGYTLAELLQQAPERRLTPRSTAGISRQICRGLNAAHEQGIIHRDIKPQNVLLDASGEVKLMDFGIARMTEADEVVTQAGLVVGTPHYMSPEQVRGKTLDPRSDVYSMGVLMYQMQAGRRPHESDSMTELLAAHLSDTPEPLAALRPDAGRLGSIVMRCLAKDPAARYRDAGALLADLDSLAQADP